MFRRVMLTLTFVAALGAAGLGMTGTAAARGGCYRGGYGGGYGGYYGAYYGDYPYVYRSSYYPPAYYGPPVYYGRSYYGGHHHGHGHGGVHFSIGF